MCSSYQDSLIASSWDNVADAKKINLNCLLEYPGKSQQSVCLFCATVTLLGQEELYLMGILRMAQKREQEGESEASALSGHFLGKALHERKGQ